MYRIDEITKCKYRCTYYDVYIACKIMLIHNVDDRKPNYVNGVWISCFACLPSLNFPRVFVCIGRGSGVNCPVRM